MSVRVALSNILHGKDTCRFCCEKLGTTRFSLNDEVAFENVDGTLDFYEVLIAILGAEITHTISRNDFICNSCRLSCISSYKFIKMCKESSNQLYSLLNKVSNVMDSITDEDIDCKSIFITLNNEEAPTSVYYNYKKIPATQPLQKGLLEQLQDLIKESQVKPEPEIVFCSDFQHDSDEDTFDKTEYITLDRQKKKNRNKFKDIACEDDPNKCKICLKTYAATRYLRNHYLQHHAPKQWQCSMCPKKFSSNGYLQDHITRSHTPAVCSHCGKTLKSKKYLKRHEITHFTLAQAPTPIVCPKCGKSYKNAATLRAHICQTENVKLEKIFSCNHCGRKYGREKSLKRHITFMHKGVGHTCGGCGKKFPFRASLRDHMVVHTKEKKFACEICGGRFVSKMSLLYHTRIHTGEKPYKCEFCDKRFLSTSRRMDHMRIHHLVRTRECDLCGNKYKQKHVLERHIARHYNPKSQMYIPKIT